LLLGALVLTFLIANPVVLSPEVLKYFVGYVGEQTLTHHGYFMMSHLYRNGFLYRPGSIPVYYYVLLLLLKTPLPVLGALLLGLVLTFRQKKNPQHFFLLFMFLWWIIPFSLSGGKFLRYSLSVMPTVCIISALGAVKAFDLLSAPLKGRLTAANHAILGFAFLALFFAIPLLGALRSAPFYSLYLNPLGSGRAAYYFPHDEIYDAGLRETIREICDNAPQGARVAGESPAVFKYYIAKFGRSDLVYFNLSDPADQNSVGPTYLVVQEGRKYFENLALIDRLEAVSNPVQIVRIGAAVAAKVYSVNDLAQLRTPHQEIGALPVDGVADD
jgi:4-amino-4-deoxy-L-arabinose transferase-like glycosyltransferase